MSQTSPLDNAHSLSKPSTASSTLADALNWLAWRINRLRCMSLPEIAHRLLRSVLARAERQGWIGTATFAAADLSQPSTAWIVVPPMLEKSSYLAAADRLVLGRFNVFALHDVDLGDPPRWNHDPRTGIEVPLSFGKLIDYRDPQQVGDIKYLWEPNRHLHLVTLAQAYALSGNSRYFEVIVRHLESWFLACPPGKGANWTSALEVSLRLLNWSVTWQILGGLNAPVFKDVRGLAFRRRWLNSIHHHARFVCGYFSLFSSANNHLIGEASGLFVAALTWPYWPQATGWRKAAQRILEREAQRQNAADGVNREQAVSYQQFELDLLLLPWLAGRANGVAFSAAYQTNIERMMNYLASIMDAGGHLPMFGDADDGVVVRLDPNADHCRYSSLLATGAILFQRSDFRLKARMLDDKTRWLLGADAATNVNERFEALPITASACVPMRQGFPLGGYYILGCDFETRREIRLVADAGPLGYQRIAAHGHADALSFTLSLGGCEFLIDPGTYAYHTQGPWRAYFRGTSAHNTVRVDGVDQSLSGGNFMWLKKAAAGCTVWQRSAIEDLFTGWHSGYQRLPDPVMHRRRIHLDKQRRQILIDDHLQMNGTHQIELFFHCSEACEVEPGREIYVLTQGSQQMTLRLPIVPGTQHRSYHGSDAPIHGWVSRRFDEKQPTTTIVWSGQLTGNVTLRSELLC